MRVLFLVLGILVASFTFSAPAYADNVGTLIEVELFKDFTATGYGNTCEGVGEFGGAFKAGSVLYVGIPFDAKTPFEGAIGSAQMRGSELTDRGTCLIRYVGSAPRGITALGYMAQDPYGSFSPVYVSGVGQGVTNAPISRPDMPSLTQLLRLPMFAKA